MDKRAVSALVVVALGAGVHGCAGCSDPFQRGDDLGVAATPATVSFGGVVVNTTETFTVTLAHAGETGTLRLQPAELVEASPDFTITGPEKLELQPGDTTTLTVTYTPTDGEYDSGVVRVRHNVPERAPLDLPITTVQQAPSLYVSPGLIEFGAVSAGTVHTRTVSVQNAGTLTDRLDAIGLDLELGAPFELSQSPPLPIDLPVGGQISLEVTYSPSLLDGNAAHQALLRFVTGHPATNNRAAVVRGTSRLGQLEILPAWVDFGWTTVGDSETVDVRFQNGGDKPIEFESFGLVDTSPGVTLLGALEPPFTLGASEVLTVTVRFSPEGPVGSPDAPLARLVAVTDDYVLQKREVPIHGRAAEPALVFVPDEVVDLGVVAVGYRHQRTVQVINVGGAPATLFGATLAEDTPEGFEVLGTPALPVTLAPGGGVAELVVAFTTPEGLIDDVLWGELTLTSDDPVAPETSLALRARTAASPHCLPRLEPPVVEFGTVAPGALQNSSFVLLNDGSMPCTLLASTFLDCKTPVGPCQPIQGGSASFELGKDGPPSGSQVFFDQSLKIPVRYQPAVNEGEHAALTVLTLLEGAGEGPAKLFHSPAGGVLPTLHGSVGNAGVVVKPPDVTFGLTTVGCGSLPSSVDVLRVGALPIQLVDIDASECGGAFQIEALALPVPLYESPEHAVPLGVQFAPLQEGFVECTVLLSPDNLEAGVGALTVRGVGTSSVTRTDYFQQAAKFQVDILFVVDNSGSMGDEQESLVAGFEGFVEQAGAWDVQYQIGVVTTDVDNGKGNLVGFFPYLDNNTTAAFPVNALVGTDGSGDEQGLRTAWLALQPNKLIDYEYPCTMNTGPCHPNAPESTCVFNGCGGPNRGFVREGALLAIIWISDEEEHSDVPVEDYVAYFQGLKPPGHVRAYAIVGDPVALDPEGVGGCGGGGGTSGSFGGPSQGAEPGDRYVQAAEALDGAWFSICDFGEELVDQPPLLEQIGKDAFKPTHEFALAELPAPDTIEVQVQNEVCTEGWVWDEAANSIVFDPASPCFPGPSETVKVIYEPVCHPLFEAPSSN